MCRKTMKLLKNKKKINLNQKSWDSNIPMRYDNDNPT